MDDGSWPFYLVDRGWTDQQALRGRWAAYLSVANRLLAESIPAGIQRWERLICGALQQFGIDARFSATFVGADRAGIEIGGSPIARLDVFARGFIAGCIVPEPRIDSRTPPVSLASERQRVFPIFGSVRAVHWRRWPTSSNGDIWFCGLDPGGATTSTRTSTTAWPRGSMRPYRTRGPRQTPICSWSFRKTRGRSRSASPRHGRS